MPNSHPEIPDWLMPFALEKCNNKATYPNKIRLNTGSIPYHSKLFSLVNEWYLQREKEEIRQKYLKRLQKGQIDLDKSLKWKRYGATPTSGHLLSQMEYTLSDFYRYRAEAILYMDR